MIDVMLLKKPLDDLAATLGTGIVAGADPVAELTRVAATLHQVGDAGMNAARQLEPSWQGLAAEAAANASREITAATDVLAQDGEQLSVNWLAALEAVLRGVGDLALIGASFVTVLQNSQALLSNPIGQLVLLKEALAHLSRAIDVVIRLSGELSEASGNLDAIGTGMPALPGAGAAPLASSAMHALGPSLGPDGASVTLASDSGSSDYSGITGGTIVRLPDGSTTVAPTPEAAAAVRNALSQQGVPYVWGGTSPGAGFDCSGLTQWAYRESGIEIPRLAQEQNIGTPVAVEQAMAGDLVVWDGHVAMALGNGQMVEAGDPVSVSAIRTDNLGQAFYGVYRPTA
ncbi:C40 family peptidase [Hoyosella sp. G463]|uniref:C40 family peptidase n=1 Tax=Lolliginicoccus lacisalsi TaxID=2742202 RepID=A0A927PMH8_9ACTN|nr:C40 family peptidase [Lolliginicoccus lacisalsi]MBD8506542.1 C40 family peptidase [Lolliginicoccus lacisalsi]